MSPEMPLRRAAWVAGAALCFIPLTACGSKFQLYKEDLVRNQMHGAEDAPVWVRGAIPNTDAELAFVGRGNAYNVLDERKAFDEALMHARQQLAEYVGTRVSSEMCDKDWAKGVRYLPYKNAGPGDGERPGQEIQSRVHQLSEAIVGELLPRDQYWEQWDVFEQPGRHIDDWVPTNSFKFDMRRYKCWVLATVQRERVEKFVDATLASVKADVETQKAVAATKEAVASMQEAQQISAALAGANADLEKTMQMQQQEIMKLRERIHYGRVFRLTSNENCPIADPCVPPERPQWRNATLRIDLAAKPAAAAAPAAAADCAPCSLPLGGK